MIRGGPGNEILHDGSSLNRRMKCSGRSTDWTTASYITDHGSETIHTRRCLCICKYIHYTCIDKSSHLNIPAVLDPKK